MTANRTRNLRHPHLVAEGGAVRPHPRVHGRPASLVALLAGLAIVGSACSGDSGPVARLDRALFAEAGALQPFDRCDDLLDHLHAEAGKRVTAYGLPGVGGGPIYAMEDSARSSGAAPPVPTTAAGLGSGDGATSAESTNLAQDGDAAQPGFSSTNVVEAGVDEPDAVKTDGNRLYAIAAGKLRVVAIAGPAPVELGSLQLPGYGQQLLLFGTTVVVLGSAEPDADAEGRQGYQPLAALYQVDVSDPAGPRLVQELRVEGQVITARMVDGVARVVVQSAPVGLPFLYPSGPGAEEQAVEVNRSIIASSTLDDWVPSYELRDGDGDVSGSGRLVGCEAFNRPPTFHGFGTLSVLTVNLQSSLTPGDATAILADGQRVYASHDNLYVAIGKYQDPSGGVAEPGGEIAPPGFGWAASTAVHAFSITGTAPAAYIATGEVPGELLNDFSMSEHGGDLRLALTSPQTFGTEADQSESRVVVLRRDGTALRPIGEVGGLGKGERIFGVRFVGDVAYVVTFRQTDPLYVVDLSRPEAPAVTGELKILGYSAYLHPLGDGRLLGVGQDATEEGRRTGAQVSLFDVSDPANPTRLSQYVLPNGWAQAEGDHHSFLWWSPERLVLMPINSYDPAGVAPFAGMVGLDVSDAAIAERGRVSHPTGESACPGPIPVDGGPAAMPAEGTSASATDGGSTSGGAGASGSSGAAAEATGKPVPAGPVAAIAERQVAEDTPAVASAIAPASPTTMAPPTPDTPASSTIAPDCYRPVTPVNRAVIVGDATYTVSEAGVMASNLSDLGERGWLPFS